MAKKEVGITLALGGEKEYTQGCKGYENAAGRNQKPCAGI